MCWNYTARFTEHDAQSAATLPLTRTFLSVRRWQEKGTRESCNVVVANEMRDAIVCARAPRAFSRRSDDNVSKQISRSEHYVLRHSNRRIAALRNQGLRGVAAT